MMQDRRNMLWNSAMVLGTVTGAVVGRAAWATTLQDQEKHKGKSGTDKGKEGSEPEVTATEDLMREHGVIRRALLVYWQLVEKVRTSPGSIDAASLHKTAQLFRTFAEDYHERMLEEQHIFPIVQKMKGEAAKYPEILVAQHQIGRQITDYILAVTNSPKISAQHAEPLAKVFEGLFRMYENHAAREHTIVFPAWKENFSNKQLDEIS